MIAGSLANVVLAVPFLVGGLFGASAFYRVGVPLIWGAMSEHLATSDSARWLVKHGAEPSETLEVFRVERSVSGGTTERRGELVVGISQANVVVERLIFWPGVRRVLVVPRGDQMGIRADGEVYDLQHRFAFKATVPGPLIQALRNGGWVSSGDDFFG